MGFWFLGCLVVLFWIYSSQVNGLNLVAGFFLIILAGCSVFLGLKSARSGVLEWDGQVWHWESTGYQAGVAEYQVVVAADFQHMVLLQLENQANARLWLWTERSALPERWLDLRRAVYSPHREQVFQVAPG